jgi:hypothetical protein
LEENKMTERQMQGKLELEFTYLNLTPMQAISVSKAGPMATGEMPIVLRPIPAERGKVFATMPKTDYASFRSGADTVEMCYGVFRKTGDVAREFRVSEVPRECWSDMNGIKAYDGFPVRVLTYELQRAWTDEELKQRER